MPASARSVAAALAVVLSACAPSSGEAGPSPSPVVDTRLDAVREARATVASPAVELREAAQVLAGRLEALRTELPTAEAADRASELLDEPMTAAATAADAVRGLPLPDGPDAERARRALDAAADAVDVLLGATEAERTEVLDLAAVDTQLLDLTRAWDEPGSRRQQLDRLAALADEAEDVAVELDSRSALHPCSTAYARRAEHARHVAAVTRELRDHVARYEGRAFDERRAELAGDPLGTGGTPPGERDAEELRSCWRDASEGVAAVDAVDAAMADLERALNPSDLATGAGDG